MRAYLKNARISPKKMNLVAGMIRGKKATDALTQLKFTPKKAAQLLYKTLSSAVANAANNLQQEKDKLVIKSILVNKGTTYKRGLAVSKGRYHRILKRNTNLTIEIGLEEPKEALAEGEEKKNNKTTTKKAEASTDTPKSGAEKKPATKKPTKKEDK